MKKKVIIYYNDGSIETLDNVQNISLSNGAIYIALSDNTEITVSLYSIKKIVEKNE